MSAAEATLKNGEQNGHAPPFGLFERSVAGRYLRAKRKNGGVALISIISFVGIMLAVAVLIIVMSVMNGFRHELLGKLLGAQGHVFVYSTATFSDPAATAALAERAAAVPGVVRAAPVVFGQAGIMKDGAFSGVQIYGLARQDLESLTLVRDNIILGSMDSFGEGERGGDSILIGNQLAGKLGLRIGDPVRLLSPNFAPTFGPSMPRSKTYYVDGIFSVGMSQIDDLFVYMPIEQARIFLDRDRAADMVEVSIEDPDDVDGARVRLRQALGGDIGIQDWRDNYASYVGALNVERNVMRLILAMLVLIAALNIISGLVMLAKNKSGDIAILRTVGATRGAIMRIFFMIGATIGILGTAAGIALGTVFCLNIGAIQTGVEWVFRTEVFSDDIYFLSQIPARVEWHEVAFIAAWGFAMSCVATLPPAWNAARLDPVEALRYG